NATAQSLVDAVLQNQNELINQQILGGPPGGVSGRGTTSSSSSTSNAGAGAAGLNTFSTGRMRGSNHDALFLPNNTSNGPYPYETREISTFGNIVTSVPGTVLGGQLKLS